MIDLITIQSPIGMYHEDKIIVNKLFISCPFPSYFASFCFAVSWQLRLQIVIGIVPKLSAFFWWLTEVVSTRSQVPWFLQLKDLFDLSTDRPYSWVGWHARADAGWWCTTLIPFPLKLHQVRAIIAYCQVGPFLLYPDRCPTWAYCNPYSQ